MKLLVSIIFVLALSIVLGLWAHEDAGYVLIGRGYTTLEMSLSMCIVLLVFSFVVGYMLLRLFVRAWAMPEQLRRWRHNHKARKARVASNNGLVALAQGHWQEAERMLTKYARHSDTPLLNYLSAARAAQKQNAPQRRDEYLALAHTSKRGADFAVELTQAELQMAHGQLEQSLATLMHLCAISPKHTHVLYLLVQVYQRLNSWGELKKLLPTLRKNKVLNEQALNELEKTVWLELLATVAKRNEPGLLIKSWQRIPRALRRDQDLIDRYVGFLIKQKQYKEAEGLLREALKRQWSLRLVNHYSLVETSAPEKQLEFAESLLKDHENNAGLLLALGRLAKRCELWGKARSYLEASIGAENHIDAYKELGMLLEQLEEKDAAAEFFRKGILFAAQTVDQE